MEKKIATIEIAEAVWSQMVKPNCKKVRDKLIEEGYAVPTHRTFTKWRDKRGWPKTPQAQMQGDKGRIKGKKLGVQAKEALKAVAETLVGREGATPEDLTKMIIEGRDAAPDKAAQAPTPEEQARLAFKTAIDDNLKRLQSFDTPEALLEGVSMEAMRTAHVMFGILAAMAPQLIVAAPEAVGKCFEAICAGMDVATSPIDRIVALHDAKMKIITFPQPNGKTAEILPPEDDDPLAASFKAHFGAA